MSDACIFDNCIVIATHIDSEYRIYTFRVDRDALSVSLNQAIEVDGEVTCLSIGEGYALLAGVWRNHQPFLARGLLPIPTARLEMIGLSDCKSYYI